jgi:hypothetical protein
MFEGKSEGSFCFQQVSSVLTVNLIVPDNVFCGVFRPGRDIARSVYGRCGTLISGTKMSALS